MVMSKIIINLLMNNYKKQLSTVPHNTTLTKEGCLWWQASFYALQNHWNDWKSNTQKSTKKEQYKEKSFKFPF